MSAPELLNELRGTEFGTYLVCGLAGLLLGNVIVYGTRVVDRLIDRVMTLVTMARYRERDHRRTFSAYQKSILANRAGGRCEHKHPLWIRCLKPGDHADHIIPWSKGGPTTAFNGQWLCRRHNLRKSALYPSPVYVWRLKRRRARAARRRTA